ncbi:MAG: hypothetical protein JWM80_4766 [Cyanobacteria bacterium RYN_339]|nr:hypothetical protein [Cyanobacteria bacterium RYN_339]
MLGPMEPIFAAAANRLTQHAPIGRVSRAVSEHPEPEAVKPVEAVHHTALDHHREPPAELLTVGPLGEAYEGLDGQLHSTHPAA